MPAKITRKYINLSVDELTIGNSEFTLPIVDGLVGQIIVTDGAGNLTWQSPGGTGTVTSITAGTGLNGGTITASGTIDLANTAVIPGSYTGADITVDAQGRITAAANGSSGSGTVTSITAGVGLNGGTITAAGTIDLSNTAVVAGSYNLANITVDAQGRITAAASGSSGTVTNVATSGTVNGLTLTGGPITTTGTITLGGTLTINNSDWSGTDLSIANGGTGTSTAQDAINELTDVGSFTNGDLLTIVGGNAEWATPSFAASSLYTSSGTVPSTTIATLIDTLEFATSVGGYVQINDLSINGAYKFPTAAAPIDNGKALTYDSGSGNLVFQAITASVPTGKTIWVDSVNGNDGTGLRGRQDLPFLTILAAIGAAGITAGDSIMVRPGSYTETGTVTVPQGVSLEGQGGYEVTTIIGNGTDTVVLLSQDSAMSDFTVNIPNSANNGVEYAGAAGVAGVRFLKFNGTGSSTSSGLVNSGTGKVIALEIRYGSGDLGNLLLCSDGILAAQAIHVPGSGSIQRVAKTSSTSTAGNRGRLQLLDLNAGNANVEFAVEVGNNGIAVLISLNLFNIKNGILISGNTAQTDALGGKIQTSSTLNPASYPASISGVEGFAVVVSPGLDLASAKTKIDALLEPNFLWDQSVTPNAAASEFSVNLTQSSSGIRDAALRTFGSEIINGFPEKGSGFSTGEGGSNATFNRVFQLDTAGNYLADITTDASDNTASTFTWGLAAAPANDNQSICFCTARRDVNNNLLKHWGLLMDVATNGVKTGPASPADADYIFEIYTGTPVYNNAWTAIGSMSTSEKEQYRYANSHFLRANNIEEIRFGIDNTTTWNTTTINSVEGYYARIRVRTNTTSTYPTFNQLKITPSFVQFNDKGQQQFHGLSQYRKTLFGGGNTWGLGNGVTDTSVSVASGGWTQDNTNSRVNGNGDYMTFQFAVPGGLSTAHPVKFKVIYSTVATSALTNVGMNLRVAPQEIVGNLVADSAGGIIPTARTEPNTIGYNTVAPQLVNFPDAPIYPEKLRVQEFDGYDISSYYEDDLLIIQLELVNGVTGPTLSNARPFDLWAIVIEGVSFTNGINL